MADGDKSAVPTASSTRLKREDYKRTKHDSHFSKWQVLIGPSDWEDYSQRKEGAARYRVHNLPTSSWPGLYELGIGVSRSGLGRLVGKLDPDDIVVVYLGQADNVRSRLQSYGRSGAHLGNSYATGHWDSSNGSPQKGPGLFEEIFAGGHSIVFRWASMKDKRNAEKTEALLLDTFDYAWNKGCNCARRPDDILQKICEIASSTRRFSSISKRLLFLRPNQVGIKIEANKPLSPEKCTIPADEDGKSFFKGIFKFSRWQPRLVSDKCGIDEDLIHRCGFIMNDGIPCRRPPVPGRKRCESHKGMKIYRYSSKPISEGNSSDLPGVHLDSCTNSCGVNLGDGNFCMKQAMPGRQRCEEHKGMRVNSTKPLAEENFHPANNGSVDWTDNNASSGSNMDQGLQFHSSNESSIDEPCSSVCGATLGNGSVCRRKPSQGNERCWQHKGKSGGSNLSNSSIPSLDTITCRVALQDGSVCMRVPVHGRKRCELHKGMRVFTSFN